MNRPADVKGRATYQDVLDAPPHMVAELVDGRLYLQPRPRPRHALAHSALGGLIGAAYGFGSAGPGGWWILDEPELHFGEQVVVPDVAGWRRERMPVFPETAAISLAPDWACEVLSPGTRRFDLTVKRDLYAAQGVAHLWLVDPDACTLEAFRLDAGRWTLAAALAGGAEVALEPFAACPFPLSALWPPDPDAAAP